jgi:hypothetical protein
MSDTIYHLVEKLSKRPQPWLHFKTPKTDFNLEIDFNIPDDAVWCGWFDWTGIPKTEEHKKAIALANSKPKKGNALQACRDNGKLASEKWRGCNHTEESKAKISESLKKSDKNKGPRYNRRKTVIIDGEKYLGVEIVANLFNITRVTVYNRIKDSRWNWHYE